LATCVLNPKWTFDAGFTRGWNQSLRDANDALDFLGRVTFAPNDKTSIIFVMTEGPEFPAGVGSSLPPGDNSDWWTALDLVMTRKITGKLSLGLGFDYVEAPHIPGLSAGAKQWGGAAGYVSYAFDPRFTLNTRLECYATPPMASPAGRPSALATMKLRRAWPSNHSRKTGSSPTCCSGRKFAVTTLTARSSIAATTIS